MIEENPNPTSEKGPSEEMSAAVESAEDVSTTTDSAPATDAAPAEPVAVTAVAPETPSVETPESANADASSAPPPPEVSSDEKPADKKTEISGPFAIGEVVDGSVVGMIPGGLEVGIGEIRGFMPASQVDSHRLKDISVLLGEKIRCEVYDYDRKTGQPIVSRRKVVERDAVQARDRVFTELSPGKRVKGKVTNLTEYGAFVDLGGIHGLVHVSDMRWGPVDKPGDVVSVGDEIEVQVLKLNRERGRISLGIKQTMPDPWTDVEPKYPAGSKQKVRITKLAEYGAFAELSEGVTGLIPMSELSWTQRVAKIEDHLEVGQEIEVAVLKTDAKRRRISLSIRQMTENPWEAFSSKHEPNSLISGKVSKLLDFGALVALPDGIEGMVHISELAYERVGTPGDVVQVGQEIEVKILGVDPGKHKVSLSLKATKEAPAAPVEQVRKPKKRKKPLRGGLASHFEW